jgi:hypothetical protein
MQRLVRLLPILGLFVLLGLGGWGWDSVSHDHDGEHGAPLTVEAVQVELGASSFMTDGGSSSVRDADCKGDGERVPGGFTHVRCDLRFADGATDNVVVHVLPNELVFKSSET